MNLGPMEIIVILVVVLIIFGPKNLPKLGKSLGQTVKNVREGMSMDDDDDAKKKTIDVTEDADVTTDSDADAPAPAADTVFCGACGAQNPAGNAFCSKCGAKLGSTEE